jgi:2-hydroxychromene-2-carboxylate isomerase
MTQDNAPRDVEFFFDIGSPYSYLAATQLKALGERTRARVRWRPFLLGGVFKAAGNTMPAQVPAKASYMLRDLDRWAESYGVPFRMPSQFPVNTLTCQRALVAAGRLAGEEVISPFALGLYHAYWVADRDVSDPQVIRDVAQSVGLDGDAVVAATTDAAVKDALRAATEEAVARGAFGAPTFFVGEELFWGNDRLLHVEGLLRRNAGAW